MTAAFFGVRAEALQALMSLFEVRTVVCMAGSRAEEFCLVNGIKVESLQRNERAKGLDLFQAARENLVLSAGFPWVIPETILSQQTALKVNSHPSLLPAFPGANAIQNAFHAGSRFMGVTVHLMTPEVDAGPILAQESLNVEGLELPDIYRELFEVIEPRVLERALTPYS